MRIICIFLVCILLGMLQPVKSQDFVVVKAKFNKSGASAAAKSNHAVHGNAAPVAVKTSKYAPEDADETESKSSDLASAIDAVLLASAGNPTSETNINSPLQPTVDKAASTQIRHLLRQFASDKLLRQIFHLDKKKRRKSRIRRDAEAEAVAAEAKPEQVPT